MDEKDLEADKRLRVDCIQRLYCSVAVTEKCCESSPLAVTAGNDEQPFPGVGQLVPARSFRRVPASEN